MDLLASIMLLTSAGSIDTFEAGTWQIQSRLQALSRPDRVQILTNAVELSDRDALQPAVNTFFSRFYGPSGEVHVRFQNGIVSGYYNEPHADDLRAETVPVTGSYSRNRFHIIMKFVILGKTMCQTVDGSLVSSKH